MRDQSGLAAFRAHGIGGYRTPPSQRVIWGVGSSENVMAARRESPRRGQEHATCRKFFRSGQT